MEAMLSQHCIMGQHEKDTDAFIFEPNTDAARDMIITI